ncbi:hypothetical protein [Sutterella sp.]|uniref:hypothetical protein n=1 Tax=Sutterella sp. TaxID=1981025 RepID=UPI0026DFC4AF|nr:hypothetical protein [Sutterella sp.]MDO5532900.1 hypothetical protein [Sutterella sp.]
MKETNALQKRAGERRDPAGINGRLTGRRHLWRVAFPDEDGWLVCKAFNEEAIAEILRTGDVRGMTALLSRIAEVARRRHVRLRDAADLVALLEAVLTNNLLDGADASVTEDGRMLVVTAPGVRWTIAAGFARDRRTSPRALLAKELAALESLPATAQKETRIALVFSGRKQRFVRSAAAVL